MTLQQALEISRQGLFDGGYAKAIWLSQIDGKCLVLKGGNWSMGYCLYKRLRRFRPPVWHIMLQNFTGDTLDWEPVMPGDRILKEATLLIWQLEP